MARRISLLLLLGALALPAAAEANFVYWTNQSPETTIGRAKINGTGANNGFIAGIEQPRGVAVDSRFVYWTSLTGTGAIGRANLDGSGVNHQFITTDVTNPTGIAVTSTGIYWTNEVGMGGFSIGRANIDGSNPDGQFINIDVSPCGLAADSRYLYFMDGSDGLGFGRVGLDGGGADPNFINGPEPFCGLAVDPSYLYWGSDGGNTVGRAPVGGGTAEPAFVPTGTTGGGPFGVAVNPQYVFWGNPEADAIGRANINGSSPNSTLIRGATNSLLLAAAPSNKLTFGGVERNKKKGTAKLKTKIPGPGQVTLTGGKKVKQQGLTRAAKGSFKLAVKAKGKAAKALKKKGKTKVGVSVTYTPAGVAGVPNTRKLTLILRKNDKEKKGKK